MTIDKAKTRSIEEATVVPVTWLLWPRISLP
jgi:hypothetical protein